MINKKYIEQEGKLNNPRTEEFVRKNNNQKELELDELLGCGTFINRDEYLIMLQLGVPIGVVQCVDKDDNLLTGEFDENLLEKNIYKPINSLKEYVNYLEINPHPHVMVNPSYMSKKEVRNLAYCLQQCNNNHIFDFDTKNEMQNEIIENIPLQYDTAMKIFNKYYDEDIQKKFIYEYGYERDRFYYLSGLNELIPEFQRHDENKNDENMEREKDYER